MIFYINRRVKRSREQSNIIREIEMNHSYQELENSQSFPLGEKTISPNSTSQSTESSKAFFSNPFLRLENVTCLLVAFSILFIRVFPLTILLLFLFFPQNGSLTSSQEYQIWDIEPHPHQTFPFHHCVNVIKHTLATYPNYFVSFLYHEA